MRRLHAFSAIVLAVATTTARATMHAQQPGQQPAYSHQHVHVVSVMHPGGMVGLNMGLGAATGLVNAWLHKKPAMPALLQGAMGGAVMGGGMAWVGSGKAMPIVGVQTVALGASMSRNAGRGKAMLEHITLPLFPFVVDIDHGVRVRLSAVGVAGVAMRANSPYGMQVNWRETFSSGYLVYRASHDGFANGARCPRNAECVRAGEYFMGTAAYVDDRDYAAMRATLEHEAVHAAQHVRDAVLFAVPLSDAAARRTGTAGRFLGKLLVLDAALPLSLASFITGHAVGTQHNSWYELEARSVAPGSAGSFGPP
jgi:hypothetical protein